MREAHPLSSAELEKFINAAGDMSAGYRLVGHILPFTGLLAGEFQHLHRDWIDVQGPKENTLEDADRLRISVPPESPCRGTLKFAEENKYRLGCEMEPRESICRNCCPEDRWYPRFSHRVRSIPVTTPIAVKTVRWWFSHHSSNPCSLRIARRVKEIADRADLQRDEHLTSYALRDTYAVLLLKSGIDVDDVARFMGYSRRSRLTPLLRHIDQEVRMPVGGYVSNEALIEELQRLSEAVHRVPKKREMDSRGEYSGDVYQKRFGGWNEALKAAGFEPQYKSKERLSEEMLLDDLRRLNDELGHPPSQQEVGEYGNHSSATYYRRFGGLGAALQLAGLND